MSVETNRYRSARVAATVGSERTGQLLARVTARPLAGAVNNSCTVMQRYNKKMRELSLISFNALKYR